MTKFGRASLKDGQVITRCHENVTKMSLFWDDFVREILLLHKIIFVAWPDWLVVPLTTCHNSDPVIRVRVSTLDDPIFD